MRVGRWRERLEEPLFFVKTSLYLNSSEHIRIDGKLGVEERREC
jgi:hypothetical protein